MSKVIQIIEKYKSLYRRRQGDATNQLRQQQLDKQIRQHEMRLAERDRINQINIDRENY